MPKGIALGTNNRQRHFAKGVQQAFGRGLTGATFGITSEETSKLLVLLTQTLPDHLFQQGDDQGVTLF